MKRVLAISQPGWFTFFPDLGLKSTPKAQMVAQRNNLGVTLVRVGQEQVSSTRILQGHDAKPERFTGLCAANAMLTTGQNLRLYSRRHSDFTTKLT